MHKSFCLPRSEFTEVYMANPFVQQLNIKLSLQSFCIHLCVHLNRVEVKHVIFSFCLSDKLALILDEATFLVESYFLLCSTIWPTETNFL